MAPNPQGDQVRTGYDWEAHFDRQAHRAGPANPLGAVQRTKAGQPISEAELTALREWVVASLELESHHDVADLCCGNGLLTSAIDSRCRSVVAVDVSEALVRDVLNRTSRTTIIHADIRDVDLPASGFDRVLISAALQHFDHEDVPAIVRKAATLLREDGLLLITDIPDRALMWDFFDTTEREQAYFTSVEQGTPLLGSWFDRSWLERLARHSGFLEATALDQPAGLPDRHFRFDLRCRI